MSDKELGEMLRLSIIAACVLAACGLAAGIELPNPGFEREAAGEIPGWRWLTEPADGKVEVTLTGEAHSGAKCARVKHEGSDAWYLKNAPVPVQPGKAYVAKAWIRVNSGATRLRIVAIGEKGDVRLRVTSTGKAYEADGKWRQCESVNEIPEGCTKAYVEFYGDYGADLMVDDVEFAEWQSPGAGSGSKVAGYAAKRVEEKIGRGVVAIPAGRGMHVSWRLLKSDPADAAFEVYRLSDGSAPVKLNAEPISKTTDFMDTTAEAGQRHSYCVTMAGKPIPAGAEMAVVPEAATEGSSYISIPPVSYTHLTLPTN